MKTPFVVSILLTALALTACSSGPSTSDAKDAVTLQIGGGCNRLAITDFEKVNGVAQGDSGYQLSVTYKLEVKPPTGDELTQDQYTAKLQELQDKEKQTTQAKADLEKSLAAFLAANNVPGEGALYDLPVYAPLIPQYKALTDQYLQQYPELTTLQAEEQKLRSQPSETFWADCRGIRQDVAGLIGHNADPYYNKEEPGKDAYLNGFTVDVSETLNMIKTDNGWKENL